MRRFTPISLAVLAILSIACGVSPSRTSDTQPVDVPASAPAASATAKPLVSVAAGPVATKPALLVMPNVVGKNAAIAQDELVKAGFTNLQFVSDNGKLVLLLANWTVTKQTTSADTQVASDTLIVITCTKG